MSVAKPHRSSSFILKYQLNMLCIALIYFYLCFVISILGNCCVYAETNPCPKVKILPAKGFTYANLTAHTWYAQYVQPIIYQGPSTLFCFRETYTLEGSDAVWLRSAWRAGSVNGPVKTATIHGYVNAKNPSATTKNEDKISMKVGPRVMPKFLRGPYWVIAFDEQNVEWMIGSGGEPKYPTKNGKCKPGWGFNNSGLWFFTRDPVVEQRVLDQMWAVLNRYGIDATIMRRVQHERCDYTSLNGKNADLTLLQYQPTH